MLGPTGFWDIRYSYCCPMKRIKHQNDDNDDDDDDDDVSH